MPIVNNGNGNKFLIDGSGTTINSPTFNIPDTTGYLVASVTIAGVADCTTAGS